MAIILVIFGVLAALGGLVAWDVYRVRALRREQTRAAVVGGLGLLLLIVGISVASNSSRDAEPVAARPATTSKPRIQKSKSNRPSKPITTPKPTPKPTPNDPVKAAKRDFLASVDESISGADIAGNPYKYVGRHVDLHCTVSNIPSPDFFNAACGTDSNGPDADLVIRHNTVDLSSGQELRILGTVVDPIEGTNAMGGWMNFPTVEARFME